MTQFDQFIFIIYDIDKIDVMKKISLTRAILFVSRNRHIITYFEMSYYHNVAVTAYP